MSEKHALLGAMMKFTMTLAALLSIAFSFSEAIARKQIARLPGSYLLRVASKEASLRLV
ncbi:MAG: hypothetical protein ABSF63_16020 [Candidatus Bathyarchaeia archaeon]